MKNTIKIVCALLLVLGYSCSESDGRFKDSPENGWVQFLTSSSSLSIDTANLTAPLELPIYVNVPLNQTDLTINYDLVSVEGPNPNSVFSNSGSIVVPAGTAGTANVGGYPKIVFNLAEASNIAEKMVFDVVLRSTDRESVVVGVAGDAIPTVYRITICPSLTSGTGSFIGNYVVSDLIADSSPFGVQFLVGATVTLTEGASGPFSRVFQIDYLPGIAAGPPTIPIRFSFATGKIVIQNNQAAGLACGGGTQPIFLGADASKIINNPCGDKTVRLNMVDFQGGACGQSNIPFALILTKM